MVKLLSIYMREFGGHFFDSGITPTLEAAMGGGGNNTPIVFIQKIDSEEEIDEEVDV